SATTSGNSCRACASSSPTTTSGAASPGSAWSTSGSPSRNWPTSSAVTSNQRRRTMPDTQGSPPRVMLVTDRRRLTAALGIPDADWEGVLTEQIRGALAGGVDVVQVREPDLAAAQLSHFLRTLFQNVADCRARIVVND